MAVSRTPDAAAISSIRDDVVRDNSLHYAVSTVIIDEHSGYCINEFSLRL